MLVSSSLILSISGLSLVGNKTRCDLFRLSRCWKLFREYSVGWLAGHGFSGLDLFGFSETQTMNPQ
jgi:hypothetical protein